MKLCEHFTPEGRYRRRFVYFIGNGEAIKIGWAVYVEMRKRELQVGHHKPLKIIASFPGTRDDESALHRKFKDIRLSGEWFQPTPTLLSFIADLERLRYLLEHFTITEIIDGKHLEQTMFDLSMRDYSTFKAWRRRQKHLPESLAGLTCMVEYDLYNLQKHPELSEPRFESYRQLVRKHHFEFERRLFEGNFFQHEC